MSLKHLLDDPKGEALGHVGGDEEEDKAAKPAAGEGDKRGGDERGDASQVAGEQEKLGWHQQRFQGERQSSHGPLHLPDDAER